MENRQHTTMSPEGRESKEVSLLVNQLPDWRHFLTSVLGGRSLTEPTNLAEDAEARVQGD